MDKQDDCTASFRVVSLFPLPTDLPIPLSCKLSVYLIALRETRFSPDIPEWIIDETCNESIPQFSFYRWPRISPGKQGRAFPNCEKTPWKRACLFRETVSDGGREGGRRPPESAKQEKLQPSNRLITNLSWVEIRTRSFGRNRCSKSFSLSAGWIRKAHLRWPASQNFQRFSPPTITHRWKMTTALLPARHGSFVIYRPLRFHVIEIFPLAFSQRYFARRYFSIPLSIVSRSLKIYILCTDDNEYQRCFFRV